MGSGRTFTCKSKQCPAGRAKPSWSEVGGKKSREERIQGLAGQFWCPAHTAAAAAGRGGGAGGDGDGGDGDEGGDEDNGSNCWEGRYARDAGSDGYVGGDESIWRA